MLRLAAAHRRRQLALLDRAADARREGARATSSPARTRPSAPRTAALSGSGSRSSTGWSCATSSRSRPRRSGTTAPRSSPARLTPEEIGTEVFFLPAATHLEKDGSFTNTQRLLQWHDKAVEPQGDCRSELWFYFHLGRKLRERLAGSNDPKDAPLQHLTWDYPTVGEEADPVAEAVLAEISGRDADGKPLDAYKQLQADGSTTCGCWIYCGSSPATSTSPRGGSRAGSRR